MANESTQPEPIQIMFAKGTDTGRTRDHNEDHVDAFSPSDPAQRQHKGDLFLVADGMGGHQAGEVASEGAVRVISHEYYADPDPDIRGSLVRAVQKANAFIHQQAQQVASRMGMGTTVVAAVLRGRELYLANVGDSRAYMMRQGKIKQVTRDHSLVEEQVRAGILTREEARAHPQRNVITRALGSKAEVQVDTYNGELQSGDTLLLCSDGLSEHVGEADMLEVLGRQPPQEAVPRLIAMANKRGGSDNISVLVVQAVPPAGVATTKPAMPAAPAKAAPARKRSALPLIAGIGAIVVIAAVVLGAGALLAPQFLGGKETPTPTMTPPITPTTTPTLVPTSTPRATEGAATATPAIAFRLQGPEDGTIVRPGLTVDFRWDWIGELPRPFIFVVNSDQGELCQSDQGSCTSTESLGVGVYEWWVELRGEDQAAIAQSEHWTLHVRVPPTNTPTPTHTPTPTEIPPTETPSGGGGGGGGDGDEEPPSTRP